MLKNRRISVLLSLAAYLAAGVVAGWHLGHDHRHPSSSLTDDPPATTQHCNCSHHGREHSESPAAPHRPPADHNEDDCQLCQFLAQKPLPVTVVADVDSGELIALRADATVSRPVAPRLSLPLSRAPPARS